MGATTTYKEEYNELTKYLAFCDEQNYLPSHIGYAKYLGHDRDTLYTWRDQFPEFKTTLKRLGEEQEERLVNAAYTRDKPTGVIFLLKATRGFKDTSVIEHTGADGNPFELIVRNPQALPPPQIDGQILPKIDGSESKTS